MPLRVRFHVGIEPLGRTGKVPVGLAPNLVSVKQRLRAGVDPLSLFTAFFEELQAQVIVTLVLVDHFPHSGRHFQTETLVLEVPGDQPSENALHSFLRLKLIFQVLVLLRFGEVAVELNDPHTVGSEQGLVADSGKIVAGEPEGELRQEGCSSLIEVPSLDFLAARELLDCFLVQLAILVALCHCDEPFAFQGSQHGVRCFGVLRALCLADDRHGGHGSIITEKVVNCREHGGLAVASGLAVKNKHTFLVRHTQHGVPQRLLQIVSLVFVITSDLCNKLLPAAAPCVLQGVVEVGLHGQKVVPVMLPELHLFEVESAVLAVDKVGICVKLRRSDGKHTGSVLHQPVTEAPVAHLYDELHVLGAAFFIGDLTAIESHQAAELFDLFRYQQRTRVLAPCPLGVGEPAFRFGAVAGIILVALGKQLRHAGLVPRIPRTADWMAMLRLCFLNLKHHTGLSFVHDVATIGELEKSLFFGDGCDFISHSFTSFSSSLSPAPRWHSPESLHPTMHSAVSGRDRGEYLRGNSLITDRFSSHSPLSTPPP